jgi:hypothetical protein
VLESWQAYGSAESASEKEVLDQLYSECAGSLAWLSGEVTIPLIKVMAKSPAMKIVLPRTIRRCEFFLDAPLLSTLTGRRLRVRRYQSENPDLHDVYEKKLAAMSKKHFSKSIWDVQRNIQRVVDWLEAQRHKSGGPWLLGNEFGRADAVATAYLQWLTRCNEYNAAPIVLPEGLLAYLNRAKARASFQEALGQYGEDAFVLTTMKRKNRAAGRVLGAIALLVLGGVAARRYL